MQGGAEYFLNLTKKSPRYAGGSFLRNALLFFSFRAELFDGKDKDFCDECCQEKDQNAKSAEGKIPVFKPRGLDKQKMQE